MERNQTTTLVAPLLESGRKTMRSRTFFNRLSAFVEENASSCRVCVSPASGIAAMAQLRSRCRRKE